MLNYISAELWRMTRRWQSWMGWGIFLVLVVLMAVLWGWEDPMQVVEGLNDFLLVGLYLAFPLAVMADEDLWKSGVLCNEVSWGLPRSRIYLGKLLSALTAGVILMLATVGVFLVVGLAPVIGTPDKASVLGPSWARLEKGLLIAVPRYVGAAALAHFLCFTLRPGGLGAVIYYIYITMGELFLSAVRFSGMGPVGDRMNALAATVRPVLLSSAFFSYSGLGEPPPPPGVAESWVTGAVWLAGTCVLGLILLRRREIK